MMIFNLKNIIYTIKIMNYIPLKDHKKENLDKYIVLDLDSTLVHSSTDMIDLENLKLYSNSSNVALRERIYRFDLIDVGNTHGLGIKTQMWGVFRPHLMEFVIFMSIYFKEIYIYSAGLYKYVHAISDEIFSNAPLKPSIIFSRDECIDQNGDIIKPLTKIYNSTSGPNETNTLVLDDREGTFALNPYNAIKIPIYEPNSSIIDFMRDDICLLQLMYWLSSSDVLKCVDIRTLDKTNIFKIPLNEYTQYMNQNIINMYMKK